MRLRLFRSEDDCDAVFRVRGDGGHSVAVAEDTWARSVVVGKSMKILSEKSIDFFSVQDFGSEASPADVEDNGGRVARRNVLNGVLAVAHILDVV